MKRVIAATSIAAVALSMGAAPAVAADTTVSTVSELNSAVAGCTHGDAVTLGADLVGTTLTINCDLTLDLAGNSLDLNHIKVDGTNHLTIADFGQGGELNVTEPGDGNAAIEVEGHASVTINGGTVTAAGGPEAAGIGGGKDGDAGTITIEGTANVTATGRAIPHGWNGGAGIGGGRGGDGGTTTIRGSASVTAAGDYDGAGVGGGDRGSGGTITIEGAAHVTATTKYNGAGIGGGSQSDGGTITIGGNADVTATTQSSGSGIGGGRDGDGESITIGGNAHVTATGGLMGAGIGGGYRGEGGAITIEGSAHVAATARTDQHRDDGAGIGGGYGGPGGDVTITDAADVTAVAGPTASAVGAGVGTNAANFGSLQLDATLRVPSGELRVPIGANVSIGTAGKLLGTVADPTAGANISGDGQIVNDGVIALRESRVNVAVTGNNYAVTLDARDGNAPTEVRVFAPTFDEGHRTLPAVPGNGWNTSTAGTGDWFTGTTEITTATALYTVGGFPFLDHQINTCADGDIVAPYSDVTGDMLTINCNMTLDLAGNSLDLNHIKVADDNHLTITDSGQGGELHVTEPGDENAAIEAENAASVTINGGTITATGGSDGAGIGGGSFRGGGRITITEYAQVTAVGGAGASAVGAGWGSEAFGSLQLDATLHMPEGELRVPEGAIFTIDTDGKLLGTVADPTIGATISGDGQIDNGGVIALDESLVDATVDVTGHNYLVSFDAQDGSSPTEVRVFAPTFDEGYRDWIVPPAASAWNTAADGRGAWFASDMEITADTVLYAVPDFPSFAHEIATCTNGDLVALDREMTGDVLTIDCDLTLDLAGHTFNLDHIKVAGTNHLTITDSGGGGELNVTEPGDGHAAIEVASDASVTINGGTVTAQGGNDGAGIGGGNGSDGGHVTITGDAHVTASGGRDAAGIGGGDKGAGGVVTISGDAEVVATGVNHGAGIGGGNGGDGSHITITDDAQVTATGGDQAAGIGGGDEGDGGNVTIAGAARVLAVGGDYGNGLGAGDVGDGGAISITGDAVVTAIPGSQASALGAGRTSHNFGTFELDATLHVPSGELRVPSNADFTIEANGQLLGTLADPTTGATITGYGGIDNGGVIALDESLVDVAVKDHNYLVTFDTQDGKAQNSVRVFAPSFDAGFRTIPTAPTDSEWNTAADGTGDWFTSTTEITGDLTVFATTGPATDITLSAPTTTVNQGDSLTFTITATDANGNPVNTADAVLTSSVPTDIIDGTTVTFVDASPHVITVTLGDAQSSLTIEVTPTAAPDPNPEPAPDTTSAPMPVSGDDQLATTGTDPATSGFAILALLLLAAGSALLVTRRSITG